MGGTEVGPEVMANGHSSATSTNGTALAPHHSTDRVGPNRLIHQLEYVRLLEQALYKLGYHGVAKQLERDSVGGSMAWLVRSVHVLLQRASQP